MAEEVETSLYGKHPAQVAAESGDAYESPDEYADQGDTRVIRNLMFSYTAASTDIAGNQLLSQVDVPRDEEVTVDQIGLQALKTGEETHSFYTTAELEALRNPSPSGGAASTGDVSSMGEFELSEWLKAPTEETGRPPTINDVLEKVGNDKELAHRMLQAENIRSDGDPRAGLESGLEEIIKGD